MTIPEQRKLPTDTAIEVIGREAHVLLKAIATDRGLRYLPERLDTAMCSSSNFLTDADRSNVVAIGSAKAAGCRSRTDRHGTSHRVRVPIGEATTRAPEPGQVAIILARNRLTGDTPSSATDIDLTNRIMCIAKPLDIGIHGHLIVGATQMFSFRDAGYLK